MDRILRKINSLIVPAVVLLGVVAFVPTAAGAPPKKKTATTKTTTKKAATTKVPVRKSGDVKKEKLQTEKEIAATKKKISDTQKKITTQLNHLSDIDSQIERQENTIVELTDALDALNLRSEVLTDSINRLLKHDSLLCVQVANIMRRQRVQRNGITPLGYITGAASVRNAVRRYNYLKALQRADAKKVRQLRQQRRDIETARAELDSVVANQQAAVKQLSTAKAILDSRRQQAQTVVNGLRSESDELNKVLKAKQQRMKQLESELNRIIAEEMRRAREEEKKRQQQSGTSTGSGKNSTPAPAKGSTQGEAESQRTLTGTFAANKGRLLFPVAGKYTITGTFGRSRHGEHSHVEVDNSGIDITVAPGTKARAIFEGTVSSVVFIAGYENIVIVRHGEYLTVYAGLSSVNVKKGEKIGAGGVIGTIATVDGSTTLHFEVRKERTKLNPLQWVR